MKNCGPCTDLGLETPAMREGVPASQSRDGKGKPPTCYHHYYGMPLPKSLQARVPQYRKHLLEAKPTLPVMAPDEKPEDYLERVADFKGTIKETPQDTKPTSRLPLAHAMHLTELRLKETKRCACSPICNAILPEGSKFKFAYGHRKNADQDLHKHAAKHEKRVERIMPPSDDDIDDIKDKTGPASDALAGKIRQVVDNHIEVASGKCISVAVTEIFLDAYWSKLSLEEKATLIFGK